MIIVLIGTKGQYIKMVPILLEMEQRGLDYFFINARQHGQSLDKMITSFGTKQPDEIMWNIGRDISNIKEIISWLLINSFRYTFGKQRKILRNSKKKHLLLLHGDAPPVLLGLLLGKFHNLDIAHIEAGCRTHNYFSPFPEEIIRVFADKFSKILFPLSKFALHNAQKVGKFKQVYSIDRNTVFDAVRIALKQKRKPLAESYVLASIHRFETLQSKSRLEMVVNLLDRISSTETIIFPLHESTKESLKKFDFYKKLEKNKRIIITPIMEYFTFISHIKHAKFFITDGGGPQEESHYLGTPTLILRDVAERYWSNNCLAGFNQSRINSFLANPEKYRSDYLLDDYSPAKEIVDKILSLNYF